MLILIVSIFGSRCLLSAALTIYNRNNINIVVIKITTRDDKFLFYSILQKSIKYYAVLENEFCTYSRHHTIYKT